MESNFHPYPIHRSGIFFDDHFILNWKRRKKNNLRKFFYYRIVQCREVQMPGVGIKVVIIEKFFLLSYCATRKKYDKKCDFFLATYCANIWFCSQLQYFTWKNLSIYFNVYTYICLDIYFNIYKYIYTYIYLRRR